ncbi:related to family II 2-keto-3-deoxy-D-arabino-heptulosonate 7-phosphate synthase [Phialocephala subalpina]|uniref:Phospho-2-dehydro-3-deoxyheptonate aldolase n=1 Tax=Phialocephala subalpina TaxID=576137 RepID=A0A1L7XNC4_9HELO|nr:related to family II 2-keto-3-deoxy-D-arabino-heptulosonate 7-phosphate synthase [Phialocephala subalpina]
MFASSSLMLASSKMSAKEEVPSLEVEDNDLGLDGKGGRSLAKAWKPDSWTKKPIKQSPDYDNQAQVELALAKLRRLPPIVTPFEIEKLKASLRDCAEGKAFLLQGGDCAELFDYCEPEAIESKIKLLLQMSLVLISGLNKPVVRIARMAGQYAKPRSSPNETINGKQVPSFRGDILNGYPVNERALDPSRLVSAYFHSAATLNYVRASISSGIADLHRPLDWGLGHVRDPELQTKYSQIVSSITESLNFMRTVGADTAGQLQTVDLYTSHEGLLLQYEQALTRTLKLSAAPANALPPTDAFQADKDLNYDTSAHFLWIGDRTRQIDGAHVEFFRGLANPIGIKIGPTTETSDVLTLLRRLNPRKEVGKVTLITRFGADKVTSLLAPHIKEVQNSEYKGKVVWQCDPMHGNTRSTATGIKTRQFEDILSELRQTLAIHRELNSYLGGVHLEMTGDAVTECTGGSEGLDDDDLSLNYTSYCDPRLNEKQSLELAFLIAGFYKK